MVPLVTLGSAFEGRVLVARLGSDGIVTALRGAVDGPYPFGDVQLLVDADDLDLARQLLLADEVEAAFEAAPRPRRSPRLVGLPPWLAVVVMLLVALATSVARVLWA
jgi:hypothetical protein